MLGSDCNGERLLAQDSGHHQAQGHNPQNISLVLREGVQYYLEELKSVGEKNERYLVSLKKSEIVFCKSELIY